MKHNFFKDEIIKEINKSLSSINSKKLKSLIDNLCKGNRIFLIAIGRVFLSLQYLGKRLSHLGLDVEIVGSTTEKPITKKDLLIVANGSGESILLLAITKKAISLYFC
jgi:6-phospho-3-hexuloisomerase